MNNRKNLKVIFGINGMYNARIFFDNYLKEKTITIK